MGRKHYGSTVAWLLSVALNFNQVNAAEFKHLDGVHRIEKRAHVAQKATLEARDGSLNVCGTGAKLCPSSLDGGCCPDEYDCAKESCYATTRGPSTCNSKVGWHACEAVYGGGCCPDGYMCQRADKCISPSGSPYTHGCPASHYLCPSSMGYGCCPNSMGCAVNQCYSTKPMTVTTKMTIKTTKDGDVLIFTTQATTIKEPEIPAKLPNIYVEDDTAQVVMKYFPTAVAKTQPVPYSNQDGDSTKSFTKAELAGIISGVIAALIIVIVIAYILIRRLNKAAQAIKSSEKASLSRTRARSFKPADSDIDALSVDPLISSPRPSHRRGDSSVAYDSSLGRQTPISVINTDHSQTPETANTQRTDYFNATPGTRISQITTRSRTGSNGAYSHVRAWSTVSEDMDTGRAGAVSPTAISELDSREVAAELPGPSPSACSSVEEPSQRFPSGSRPINRVQRIRTGEIPGLGVVDEEVHGFYGPLDQLVGKTKGSSGS